VKLSYGYRYSEVELPSEFGVKNDAELKLNPRRPIPDLTSRPIQGVSLGCHVEGASLPHPDPKDPQTVLMSLQKRVCFSPPVIDDAEFAQFEKFCSELPEKLGLVPLAFDTDCSFEWWIEEGNNYTEYRRQELREVYAKMQGRLLPEHFAVDGFIKDETYLKYKPARGINARADPAKCFFGPMFKRIEQQVFKLPYFIKKVPKQLRAQYIYSELWTLGARYVSTDYTSYEGHFIVRILKAIERPLYKFMTQFLSDHQIFMDTYDKYIMGPNLITFEFFLARVLGIRMTGEMNTSLGNGWANLALMLYVAMKSGYDLGFKCVVEGDDGLGRLDPNKPFLYEIFEKLGFTITKEEHDNLNTASFCGNVFDPEDLIIVTDPKEVMASFGWAKKQYAHSKTRMKMGLLRSKAMSLMYEYPGCPILQEMGYAYYRLTRGYRARMPSMNNYERTEHLEMMSWIKEHGLPCKEVPYKTRMLVESLYQIPITMQLEIEAYFNSLDEVKPINHPYILDLMDPIWKHYDRTYTIELQYDALQKQRFFLIMNFGPLIDSPLFVEECNAIGKIFIPKIPPSHNHKF